MKKTAEIIIEGQKISIEVPDIKVLKIVFNNLNDKSRFLESLDEDLIIGKLFCSERIMLLETTNRIVRKVEEAARNFNPKDLKRFAGEKVNFDKLASKLS